MAIISIMKMSQLRYHTVQCSKITVDNAKDFYEYIFTKQFKDLKSKDKDSWGSYTATGSKNTEGEQLPCNTHINRIYF